MPNVLFDNAGETSVTAQTTNTVTLTVGSGSNRVVLVGLSFGVNTITGLTVSGGGASGWAVVQGTDTGGLATVRTVMWAARTPSTGSQTFTASWTGASDCVMGVVTASNGTNLGPFVVNGVNQTAVATTTDTLVVTSPATNCLPVDVVANLSTLTSPTQTQRWNDATQATVTGGGSNQAAGSTSTSFGWTAAVATTWAHSGATIITAVEEPGGSGDEGSELVRAILLNAGVRPADWAVPVLAQLQIQSGEDVTTVAATIVEDEAVGDAGVAFRPPGSAVTLAYAMDDSGATALPEPTLAIDEDGSWVWPPQPWSVFAPVVIDEAELTTPVAAEEDPAALVRVVSRLYRVVGVQEADERPTPPGGPGTSVPGYSQWQSVIVRGST